MALRRFIRIGEVAKVEAEIIRSDEDRDEFPVSGAIDTPIAGDPFDQHFGLVRHITRHCADFGHIESRRE